MSFGSVPGFAQKERVGGAFGLMRKPDTRRLHLHEEREAEAYGAAGAAGAAVGAVPALFAMDHFGPFRFLVGTHLQHIAGAVLDAGTAGLAVLFRVDVL